MNFSKIYIKNMVCPRCIAAVETILSKMNIIPLQIQLGEVMLETELNPKQTEQLRKQLNAIGFELLDDSHSKQITKIKSLIIHHIHHLEDVKFVFSELLATELNREYSQLSKLFSSTEGITIEQFVILQKIEKVKELLIYNQITLSEIADKMGYSSVSHLSSQFKKTVGLTPSQFKVQNKITRKTLDTF
jgi:AraC family transcriptional regulator